MLGWSELNDQAITIICNFSLFSYNDVCTDDCDNDDVDKSEVHRSTREGIFEPCHHPTLLQPICYCHHGHYCHHCHQCSYRHQFYHFNCCYHTVLISLLVIIIGNHCHPCHQFHCCHQNCFFIVPHFENIIIVIIDVTIVSLPPFLFSCFLAFS